MSNVRTPAGGVTSQPFAYPSTICGGPSPLPPTTFACHPGLCDCPSTIQNGVAAPVTGSQGTGDDYAVAHVVTSNNTDSNSQAFVARSLRIQSGGVVDLARLHGGQNQNVSYSLPPVILEGGGAIRFRASNGSSTHTVSAAIANAGSSFLRINGGNYANSANLTGAISGSGSIAVVSESNAASSARLSELSATFRVIAPERNKAAASSSVNITGGI